MPKNSNHRLTGKKTAKLQEKQRESVIVKGKPLFYSLILTPELPQNLTTFFFTVYFRNTVKATEQDYTFTRRMGKTF